MRNEMMLVAVTAVSLMLLQRSGTTQITTQTGASQSTLPGQSTPSRSTLPSIDGTSADKDDPGATMREAQRTRTFATERQKKMVQDTQKLLTLATELKQEMDKSNKNEMSLDVIKKADEIERLAHDVKIRMKG